MNYTKWILIASLVLLSACSKVSSDNFAKVQEGMSMQQVVSILGEPSEVSSAGLGPISGSTAVWKEKDIVIEIAFFNEKVKLKQMRSSN